MTIPMKGQEKVNSHREIEGNWHEWKRGGLERFGMEIVDVNEI